MSGLFRASIPLMHLRCIIAAACLAWHAPCPAFEYFVSTNGNDASDGLSIGTAFRTIQRAADAVGPGDTVWVRGGEYREMVSATNYGAPGQRITFAAYGSEKPVIKASDIVNGWVPYTNAIWVRSGWEPEPQQIFDDGVSLQKIGDLPKMWPGTYTRVGTNVNDMTAGSFFYDTNANDLYVWLPDGSAPTSSVIEASTRVFCFFTPSTNEHSWFHLKSLAFRHSNTVTVTNGWPAVITGGNSIIEDCDVQWTDFAGVELCTNAQAIRCIVSNNGNSGLGASRCAFLIEGCTVLSNNLRNFNTDWHAGGIKIIPDAWGTVQNCEIGWNRGQGLWFDNCRTGHPIFARTNYIHDNSGDGLMIEITKNVTAHHNLIARNNPRSVYVSSAEDNSIFNNTIIGGSDYIAVQMFYLPTRTDDEGVVYPLRNNDFRNNIVFGTLGSWDVAITFSDSPLNTNNVCDYNCYYGPNNAWHLQHLIHGPSNYSSLDDWRAASGMDLHSISADPLFLNAAADDVHLLSQAGTWSNGAWVAFAQTSPCIDTGDPRSDASKEPPFNGGRINMGRYGNTTEASRSPDDDGDQLSDVIEWSITGSDPTAIDTDGDGSDDLTEYIAASSPIDASDRFSLSASATTVGSSSGMAFGWSGRKDRQYDLLTTTNLAAASWIVVSNLVSPSGDPLNALIGNDAWITAVDTNLCIDPRRFFKLRVRYP